ncbi:hypothetical protein GT348_08045 [Aristophania vespae]|uniref:Alpha/beta fold hydrolase n=1 Tax=Aristophania vespae TaxID=2697033 RepID=A0A6P1NFY7_9PROT|nr:hypothetical protein [Aristophania vespae]QHI96183.1 hypothetical protein GT348_08045 [Aristophania vespae]
MAVALTAPERVNKLCVADISPAQALHGSKEIIQTISSLLLPSLKTRTEIRQFLVSVLGKEDMADLVGQNINPGDPAYWTIGLKEITQSLNIIENWPDSFFAHQWNGPTLFLRGELSPYIQPKHHPLIHKLFPKADIVTLPGTNHWLHVEKPDEFNSLVLDFLKNHSES